MNNVLNICSTYFPEDRLPINRWFRFIAGKDLNLDEINTKTLLGAAAYDGYRKDPARTVKELREAYFDSPEMVTKILGINNVKKIL